MIRDRLSYPHGRGPLNTPYPRRWPRSVRSTVCMSVLGRPLLRVRSIDDDVNSHEIRWRTFFTLTLSLSLHFNCRCSLRSSRRRETTLPPNGWNGDAFGLSLITSCCLDRDRVSVSTVYCVLCTVLSSIARSLARLASPLLSLRSPSPPPPPPPPLQSPLHTFRSRSRSRSLSSCCLALPWSADADVIFVCVSLPLSVCLVATHSRLSSLDRVARTRHRDSNWVWELESWLADCAESVLRLTGADTLRACRLRLQTLCYPTTIQWRSIGEHVVGSQGGPFQA